MTKRTNGAATAAHRPRSGMHVEHRRNLSAPDAAWELWQRAVDKAQDDSWAEWARNALVLQAADELGIDPHEALRVLSGAQGPGR